MSLYDILAAHTTLTYLLGKWETGHDHHPTTLATLIKRW